MKIFKYWARESTSHTTKDGQRLWLNKISGSNESVASATAAAAKALEALKARFDSGDVMGEAGSYNYTEDGEIREQVIQTFEDDDGKIIAAITRNRYGALVLNAPNVLFADVDYPPLPRRGLIARLLGRAPKVADLIQERRDDTLARIAAVAKAQSDLGMRVYETHSGMRVIVTNKLYDPNQADSKAVLTALDSDPLFQKLCENQNCYRARLSIKPWRADIDRPPKVFPIVESQDKQAFQAWLKDYDAADDKHSVCRKVDQLGRSGVISEVSEVISIHDRYTVGKSTLPLA